MDLKDLEEIVSMISQKLGLLTINSTPKITKHGLDKLGIDVAEIDDSVADIIIGFIISSDINS